MKKILLSLIISICVLSVLALQVQVAWNPSCDGDAAGYKIYNGIVPSNIVPIIGAPYYDNCLGATISNVYYTNGFTSVITVWGASANTVVISNLLPATTYAFAATTFDSNTVESDFSGQILYTTQSIYTNGGPAPKLTLNHVLTYTTNWYNPPLVYTNELGKWVTNYYNTTPHTWRLVDNLFVPTNWVVQCNTNLANKTNWFTYATGSNDVICITITNNGGNAFFRIKI